MDKPSRLKKAYDLQAPDRPPILGGWLAAPKHIQALTGCSEDEYWAEPFGWGIKAEQVLGSDGIIGVLVPVKRGDFRIVDHTVREKRAAYTTEDVLAEIEALPSVEQIDAEFNLEAQYAAFTREMRDNQALCNDMLWSPADWDMIPFTMWGHQYGFETALMTAALYPEQWRRLVRYSAFRARQHARLRARAITEGIHPKAILTGEDICSQRGPMVSPEYLRREYFPMLEFALEPLLQVGAKVIWHCDGDCRPVLNDILACGIAGLQGFQAECGMDLEWITSHRTRRNDPLIIFGAMSVTTTLPFGTEADIRKEVKRTVEICKDRASLVFFTSNTITPDVPLNNIRAFWQAATGN